MSEIQEHLDGLIVYGKDPKRPAPVTESDVIAWLCAEYASEFLLVHPANCATSGFIKHLTALINGTARPAPAGGESEETR